MGDHRLSAKYTFLESAAHVPIVMRLPQEHGIYNRRVHAPALTADIVPKLMEVAGLQPEPNMDGRSLLQLHEDRTIYGETRNSVFATDGKLKYIYYFDHGVEQLFDLNSDSDDRINLAKHAEYADGMAALKGGLIAYLQASERPAVVENELLVTESTLDFAKLRAQNAAAWRGPLRYGQGYG